MNAGEEAREAEALAALAGQAWRAVPTSQRMADGTVLRTYGVQASGGAWLGKAHALGATDAARAAARRHAMMFAASREMFHLLREAVDAFSAEFDGDEEGPGSELVQWHSLWRERAKVALRRAGLDVHPNRTRALPRLKVPSAATAYVPPTGPRLREILGEATSNHLHVSVWDFRRHIADAQDDGWSVTCARIIGVSRRILRQRNDG